MSFRQSRLSRMSLRPPSKGLALLTIALGAFVLILSRAWLNFPKVSGRALLWSRASLLACVSWDCLHEAQFAAQRLSTEDANAALHHMRAFLMNKPNQPPPEPEDFLTTAMLSTCAVIGGAPLPPHVSWTEQSRLVDQMADLIMRLNVRVPELLAAEGAAVPLGTRTDAMFLQRGSLRSFERYIHGWGEGNTTYGEVRKRAGKTLKDRWHPVIIFRPECPSRFESCPKAWKALGQSSLPQWTGLHLLHYEVEILTNTLLKRVVGKRRFRIGSDVPSTGIVTVVAALRICKEVTVFAFNGSVHGDGDVPGQAVWGGHKLKAERKLLRWLAICPREDDEVCGKLTIYS